MDVKETAEALKVHTQTIYNMLSDGRLQAQKIGGSWDISKDQIHEMLNRSIKKMDESMELDKAVFILEEHTRLHKKETFLQIINACSTLIDSYKEGYNLGFITEQIDLVSERIEKYKATIQMSDYLTDMKIHAQQLDNEARQALKIQHTMIGDRKNGIRTND